MSADVIQARYDDLAAIAARFGEQAEQSAALQRRVSQCADTLTQEGWQGAGMLAFRAEMDDEVVPALQRLIHALEEGCAVMLGASAILQHAEEKAANLFQGNESEDTALSPREVYNRYGEAAKDEINNRKKALQDEELYPKDTELYGFDTVMGTILLNNKNRETIIEMAERYDIPPDLLAGIVASEMDFDHDQLDALQDGLGRSGSILIGDGPGVTSVHDDTLKKSVAYLEENNIKGYDKAKEFYKNVQPSLLDITTDPLALLTLVAGGGAGLLGALSALSGQKRASFEDAVEAAAIVTAGLVHYKGGVETPTDKAVVWGGFRTGVNGFSPVKDKYGYSSQEDFKANKANIDTGNDDLSSDLQVGKNAYMSTPYFELFEKAF